jgi:hypothetical protein
MATHILFLCRTGSNIACLIVAEVGDGISGELERHDYNNNDCSRSPLWKVTIKGVTAAAVALHLLVWFCKQSKWRK